MFLPNTAQCAVLAIPPPKHRILTQTSCRTEFSSVVLETMDLPCPGIRWKELIVFQFSCSVGLAIPSRKGSSSKLVNSHRPSKFRVQSRFMLAANDCAANLEMREMIALVVNIQRCPTTVYAAPSCSRPCALPGGKQLAFPWISQCGPTKQTCKAAFWFHVSSCNTSPAKSVSSYLDRMTVLILDR